MLSSLNRPTPLSPSGTLATLAVSNLHAFAYNDPHALPPLSADQFLLLHQG